MKSISRGEVHLTKWSLSHEVKQSDKDIRSPSYRRWGKSEQRLAASVLPTVLKEMTEQSTGDANDRKKISLLQHNLQPSATQHNAQGFGWEEAFWSRNVLSCWCCCRCFPQGGWWLRCFIVCRRGSLLLSNLCKIILGQSIRSVAYTTWWRFASFSYTFGPIAAKSYELQGFTLAKPCVWKCRLASEVFRRNACSKHRKHT